MDATNATRGSGSTAATPRRVFLSHTSDLGKPDEPGSFVAAAVAAVFRARHAVTDMAYFAARDASAAATVTPSSEIQLRRTSRSRIPSNR